MPKGIYPFRKRKGLFQKGRVSEKYWKNKHHSEKTKRKISESEKGKKVPESVRNKIKQSSIGKKCPWARNNPQIFKKGKKHPFWQGGKSFEPYTTDWTETLRRSIRERDNYICQLCNQYGNVVHHIDYEKKNCDPNNLITLCNSCNLKVNGSRNYWTDYFQNKL